MSGRIVAIGSSNVDFIMQVEHLPNVGETVTDGKFLQTFGGKGANQAVAAARAGGQVTFLTGLGADVYAPIILDNYQQDGIDTSHVVHAPDTACGSALVMFDHNGHNYLTVAPGANYALLPEHIDAAAGLIAEATLVIIQQEIPIPTILRALEVAEESNTPMLFNYAPVRNGEVPVSTRIHGLVVNENEASALTGLPVDTPEQALQAAETLRARGPRFVLLTLGAAGAIVVSEGVQQHVPAFHVTPIDTTAAGDVFCGALAVALVEDKPLLEAVRFASAASALSVTQMGAQPSVPRRDAIETFLKEQA